MTVRGGRASHPGILPERRLYLEPVSAKHRGRTSNALTTAIRSWGRTAVPPAWRFGAAYLGLYLLLDWASYVEPLPHTSITPWNPNTGVLMALLLRRGAG